MSDAMTAKEIGEAWLKYVDGTFMIGEGCNRPDAEKEFKRLEESGELGQARERDRLTTDMFISEILNSTPESRSKLFAISGAKSLALVHDRVQCGTQLLISFVQKGVQIKIEEEQGLEAFFQQILFQKA